MKAKFHKAMQDIAMALDSTQNLVKFTNAAVIAIRTGHPSTGTTSRRSEPLSGILQHWCCLVYIVTQVLTVSMKLMRRRLLHIWSLSNLQAMHFTAQHSL